MNFRIALRRFLLRWRLGLLATGLFRAIVFAGLLLLALGVFDFYAGLTDFGRRVAFATWVMVVVSQK